MHVLQIASDFIGTKVHVSLFKRISNQGIKQTIYCPIRNAKHIGNNFFEANGTDIVYDLVIRPFHRYFYHIKLQTIFHSLQKKVDLKKINLCHAATLMTDGGQAYKIYKKYGIPYVVAVRSTDIDGFLDKAPHTWLMARKILKNAEKIVFVSQAMLENFSNHKAIASVLKDIKEKIVLIPNGIDDYYIDHAVINSRNNGTNKLLYVGIFSYRKNVSRLCEAVLQLSKEDEFRDIKLTLVGGVGKEADINVHEWIKNHPEIIDYVGPVYEKDKLCELFKSHSVFSMPSIRETFGLVYVEALSQNLPVIYTKGEAIDGLFPPNIGVAVNNPLSVDEIKDAIKVVLQNKEKYSNAGIDFEMFRWDSITQKYLDIYYGIYNKNNHIR